MTEIKQQFGMSEFKTPSLQHLEKLQLEIEEEKRMRADDPTQVMMQRENDLKALNIDTRKQPIQTNAAGLVLTAIGAIATAKEFSEQLAIQSTLPGENLNSMLGTTGAVGLVAAGLSILAVNNADRISNMTEKAKSGLHNLYSRFEHSD